MIKNILLSFLFITTSVLYGGLVKPEATTQSLPKLSINTVKQGSTTTGTINLQLVVNLQPGELVNFTLINGKNYLFLVKSLELSEVEKSIRIYGECLNAEDSSFGFVFTKQGDIAGAIVFRKENITYAVRLNEAFKGYIFERYFEKIKIQ